MQHIQHEKDGRGASRPKVRVASADERRAKGKALRTAVPRAAHAGWKPPDERRDPVDIIRESNEGREVDLVPLRHGRMLASPFTFFRGSAALMAADLATTPTSGVKVQACGDAHLLNFGAFATPERNVNFDINDFDETLPGPWEWDVKRLTASVVVAARHLQLTETECARAAGATIRAYREHIADYSAERALEVWYDRIDVVRLLEEVEGEAARARLSARIDKSRAKSSPEYLFPKLVSEEGATPHIKDDPPLIFHPTVEEAPGLRTNYKEAIERYRASLPEHLRVLFDRFEFVDLAMKVVGVGSVGTRCFVALFMAADGDPLFLQVKTAQASVLEPYVGKSVYANHGQRVVMGQRLMQSASDVFLGWATGADGAHAFVRQLYDVKVSPVMEGWDARALKTYGRLCAWALARAHARSGDAAMMAGYMGSSRIFDDAICEFAVEYADQNQSDYRAFVKAVREGRIPAIVES